MTYRFQALVLGTLFLAAGAADLTYLFDRASTLSSSVTGNVVAFIGLGLLLIGALILFAAPQNLVASDVVDSVLSSSAENLAVILKSVSSGSQPIHMPTAVLGSESSVLLTFPEGTKFRNRTLQRLVTDGSLVWNDSRKAIVPMGFALMRSYEKKLRHDFLEVDIQQLAHSLSKAIVPELQLAAGFALRELSSVELEAIWTKPTVAHTCLTPETGHNPSLCWLCSSIACALAKSTGRPVQIEESHSNDARKTVSARYLVLSE